MTISTPPPPSPDKLTARQREIVVLMCKEFSQREIGERLGIARSTVNTHMKDIFKTLGINRAPAVAVWAAKHGLV